MMLLKRGRGTVRSRRRSAETYRVKQEVRNDQSFGAMIQKDHFMQIVKIRVKSASYDAWRENARVEGPSQRGHCDEP